MAASSSGFPSKTALVLSGGGMRGAYEVGVVAGILEILKVKALHQSPFDIFVGTSVGAINATFLAANAHLGTMNIEELCALWSRLNLHRHLRFHVFGLGSISGTARHLWERATKQPRNNFGPSLLDPEPLEALVQNNIDWPTLHQNIQTGVVHAALVTAFNVGTGRTTIFAELTEEALFRPSRDPRRTVRREPLSAAHVLASAAIPLLFPARRVGNSYFCDGGLRFNTPIAPAIRSGAKRLVVISPLAPTGRAPKEKDVLESYPNVFFLLGKLLNALLADPVHYDLHVLERFNGIMHVLEDTLSASDLQRVNAVVEQARGQPYESLETLVFMPTKDIGRIAAQHLRHRLDEDHWEMGDMKRWLLKILAGKGSQEEADWASYLLFDGHLAKRLIELGRADALERRDDVEAFFLQPAKTQRAGAK